MNLQPQDFIPFAEQLATISGEIIRRYYGKSIDYAVKHDSSPVTIVDQEVEKSLRAVIRSTFPQHGIIGEEFEAVNKDADYIWTIDPIDGTKSFMIGRPIFGTLIALLYKKIPILGIIDQPILGERWTGVKGFATNFNYEPIRVRSCAELKSAVLSTTSPDLFSGEEFEIFQRIRKIARYTIYGGDCYSYGLLARGGIDLILETDLDADDFCAMRPTIEGSGGIITDWQGNKLTLESDGRIIAAGDQKLHQEVLDMISKL